MKIRSGPFTMISLISRSRIKCWIGRRNGRISSNPFIRVVRPKLAKVGLVDIVEIRFEVAEHRRQWVETVISQRDGLRVLQFRKRFHIESVVPLLAVGLGG